VDGGGLLAEAEAVAGGHAAEAVVGAGESLSAEARLERGMISVAQYRVEIATGDAADGVTQCARGVAALAHHAIGPAAPRDNREGQGGLAHSSGGTVRLLSLEGQDGQPIGAILTNMGPPLPQPGRDWTRPGPQRPGRAANQRYAYKYS
jgi:hypothetical protein